MKGYVVLPLLSLLWWAGWAGCAIVPPPWADPGLNPCASRPGGWQLIYWPADGQCYKIFHQGAPCPATMELTLGANRTAVCLCPPGRAVSEDDSRCHGLYTEGPCPRGEYFAPSPQLPGGDGQRSGVCRVAPTCPEPGELFYPKDGRCYPHYSQGPCPRGLLMAPGFAGSRLGECRCDDTGRLGRHYWPTTATCHPHLTPGPCDAGQLFLPEGLCGCEPAMREYHLPTGACYQLGSAGPCPAGHQFTVPGGSGVVAGETRHAACRCKPGHALWPTDGACYRPFTRGPCPQGQMFSVTSQGGNETASCELLPCAPGRLYFPGGKGCHRVGSRGPCPPGQVVLFLDSVKTSVEGISYRGMCGCASPVHDERSFYPTLRAEEEPRQAGRCEAQGRKHDGAVDPAADTRADKCGGKRGFVQWEDGTCHRLYETGPCGLGQWLVPGGSAERQGRGGTTRRRGQCQCRPGYTAVAAAEGQTQLRCEPPAVRLADYLNAQTANGSDNSQS